jgi:hypothetical protein
MSQKKYTIIRKDLFSNQESLNTLLEKYKAQNLNIEKEVAKLIKLGYIKVKKQDVE